MEAWVVLLCWTLMSMLVGVGIGRWITHARQKGDAAQNFDDIIKDVMTEENKNQVEQLIKYHNNRVAAGANAHASYERLVKDLIRLKEEIKNESRGAE